MKKPWKNSDAKLVAFADDVRCFVVEPIELCRHHRACKCQARRAAERLGVNDRRLIAMYHPSDPRGTTLYLTSKDFGSLQTAVTNGRFMNPGGPSRQEVTLRQTVLILQWRKRRATSSKPDPEDPTKNMDDIGWTFHNLAIRKSLCLTTPHVAAIQEILSSG